MFPGPAEVGTLRGLEIKQVRERDDGEQIMKVMGTIGQRFQTFCFAALLCGFCLPSSIVSGQFADAEKKKQPAKKSTPKRKGVETFGRM